ncbi:unnamed protein product [Ostreobium quekettii]|uniref:AAA+ ATPase domain-containing protein n=1 Tax=Ostreobium quekettii TaxID=121088 RepID=A0A8S1JFJ1_9CHLO|nr:unnamed protein product [Ostreobium quekettii]
MAARLWALRMGGAAALAAAASGGAGAVLCDKDPPPYLDPEAWERAAKALRDINAQPNAKKIFEQLKLEELTRAQEQKAKESEFKAQAVALAKEQERVKWEEQRASQRENAQQHAEIKRYEDDLARQRMKSEHELQRKRNAELVRLQEESVQAQEQERLRVEQQIQAERRAAEQYKAELEKEIQRDRALAEAEGRIKEQRANEDVIRRQTILQYQERTKMVIQAIGEAFGHLGRGALAIVTDRDLLLRTAGLSSLLLLGFFSTREASRVVGRSVERWLGTPKLIRDTSRRHLWTWRFWFTAATKSAAEVRKDFRDIILPAQLHDHVRALAAVTSNTKRHGAPFRHMLFYGPPGTGKTLVARRLAHTSGLDYAIMSGGDVAPLAGAAVTQLHAVFDWAERSRKGLLLFIDEADAFLGRRSDVMSEGLRGALNAMLFRTGDQSKDFLVVLATNRPGDLDAAVLDRIDEVLEFPLPTVNERKEILDVYLKKYIMQAWRDDGVWSARLRRRFLALFGGGKKAVTDKIRLHEVTEPLLWQAAEATEGFSGRELAKFMASVQAAVYGTRDATLTADILNKILQFKVREHNKRMGFREKREVYV